MPWSGLASISGGKTMSFIVSGAQPTLATVRNGIPNDPSNWQTGVQTRSIHTPTLRRIRHLHGTLDVHSAYRWLSLQHRLPGYNLNVEPVEVVAIIRNIGNAFRWPLKSANPDPKQDITCHYKNIRIKSQANSTFLQKCKENVANYIMLDDF